MKFIFRFFVVLGVIFFCLLLALGYFILADPYNLRPLFSNMYESTKMNDESGTSVPSNKQTADGVSSGNAQNVSDGQAQALEAMGMDAGSVPAQFTPEQINCFVGVLGQARVDAIVAGATPTPTEFFQAKDCM